MRGGSNGGVGHSDEMLGIRGGAVSEEISLLPSGKLDNATHNGEDGPVHVRQNDEC
jgi:hypothetical protein